MAKKKKSAPALKSTVQDQPATLKDLLNPDTINRLKAQSEELKAAEERSKEERRLQAEQERKAEQHRRDNDFEHLLNDSSLDWRKYK